MAAVLLREGNYRDAETAYRDVLRSDPKNAELHDSLGVALLMQGKVRESLDAFDRAIKIAPDYGRYRVHRGSARTQLGRYGEAEEDFKVADASPNRRGPLRRAGPPRPPAAAPGGLRGSRVRVHVGPRQGLEVVRGPDRPRRVPGSPEELLGRRRRTTWTR